MNRIFAAAVLVLGAVVFSFGQPRGANQEAFIGYTVGYGPVIATVNPLIAEDKKEFTHGITLGYTAYFHRSKEIKSNKFGIGIDVNGQFFEGDAVFVTGTAGLVYKANADGKVQPFVRVMGGIARLDPKKTFVNGVLVSTDEWSPVVVAGAGFDIAKRPDTSRLKWRIGADYVRTEFGGRSHTVIRGTTGLVF